MASGKRAFEGKSQASLIAAILEHEPPSLAAIQPTRPAALDRLVRNCLAKDPEERIQTAHDVVLELRWIGEGSQVGLPAPVSARRKSREFVAWGVAAAAVAIALWLGLSRARPAGAAPERVLGQASCCPKSSF